MTSVPTRRGRSSDAKPRRFRIRVPYILLAACMAFFAYAFIQRVQEVRGLQAEQTSLQVQNQGIQQRIKHLQRQVRYERTNAYVMNAARSMLGYSLPGEQSIYSHTHHLRPRVHAAPRPTPTPGPSWQAWWASLTSRH